jgi:hypothetical protein
MCERLGSGPEQLCEPLPAEEPFQLGLFNWVEKQQCGAVTSIGRRLFGDAKVDELAQHLAAFQFNVTLVDLLELDVA